MHNTPILSVFLPFLPFNSGAVRFNLASPHPLAGSAKGSDLALAALSNLLHPDTALIRTSSWLMQDLRGYKLDGWCLGVLIWLDHCFAVIIGEIL